jgi:isoquinoline 1-oxidoreductase alpha subunit
MLRINVNGKDHVIQEDLDPEIPLLWVLRDSLNMVGTKYGCGAGFCGACTVHINGEPTRSCQVPAAMVAQQNAKVTTIEGLASDSGTLHPLQAAWIEMDVPQCGYCQAGQLMTAAALLKKNGAPSDAEIDSAMAGNICRCGTYNRIKGAIKSAAATIAQGPSSKVPGRAQGAPTTEPNTHAERGATHERG